MSRRPDMNDGFAIGIIAMLLLLGVMATIAWPCDDPPVELGMYVVDDVTGFQGTVTEIHCVMRGISEKPRVTVVVEAYIDFDDMPHAVVKEEFDVLRVHHIRPPGGE